MNSPLGTNIDTKLGMWRIIGVIALGACLHTAVTQADATPEGLADPTRPSYLGGKVSDSAYVAPTALQYTIVSEGERRAMINGRLYRVGDRFGGGKIVRIEPYEVTVDAGKGARRFRIVPKIAKEQGTPMDRDTDVKH